MMAKVGKQQMEVEVRASAEQFYHMFAGRPHHVAKATPTNVQGCELQQGEWGKVGSVVFWNYVHEGKAKVAKEVVEAVEPEKNLITYKVVEGDPMEEYKSLKITIQTRPKRTRESGSVAQISLEYETLDDKTSHPETLIQYFLEVSKEIDNFLLSEK